MRVQGSSEAAQLGLLEAPANAEEKAGGEAVLGLQSLSQMSLLSMPSDGPQQALECQREIPVLRILGLAGGAQAWPQGGLRGRGGFLEGCGVF